MSNMPAMLVEMFFHNNKEEVEKALTPQGKQKYVDILINTIKEYFQ